MRFVFFPKKSLIAFAVAVISLSAWTSWYLAVGAQRDLPSGQCTIRQRRWQVTSHGVTPQARLTTSFWLNAGRIRVSGDYQDARETLSIDRSALIQTLYHGNGTILCRVPHIQYSKRDAATSRPLELMLDDDNQELDMRFSQIASNAWIVEGDRNYLGMCVTD